MFLNAQLLAQATESASPKPAAAKPAPVKKTEKPGAPAANQEPADEKKGFRFPWSKKNKEVATPPPAPAPAGPKKPKAPPADNFTGYMTKVKAALGKRWAAEVQPRMDEFTPGNVNSTFKLDAEGKITSFAVTANSSNEAFGKFCEQFVNETPFEAPPAKLLVDGQLEIPFTFWIY